MLRGMASGRWSILGAAAAAIVLAVAVAHEAAGAPAPRWIVVSAHPNGAGAAQLFRVPATGGALEQITTGSNGATQPAFSPDGSRIAFARLGTGIFVVNLDGTGLRRLTTGVRDTFPVWSPDGRRIAFLRTYRKDWRLYVMSATGAAPRRLAQAPPAGRPSWAPSGRNILIPAGGDLVAVDSRTGKVRAYYGLLLDVQHSQTATVSPDVRRVAYVGPRVSTGPPDCGEGPCPQFGLYLASVPKPHRPRRIANDTGPAGWSPDSRNLVFVARGALVLWSVASGKRTATIVSEPHVLAGDSSPTWQPG
jgi:hypothetical protein